MKRPNQGSPLFGVALVAIVGLGWMGFSANGTSTPSAAPSPATPLVAAAAPSAPAAPAPPAKLPPDKLRESLRAQFEKLMRDEHSHLNGVRGVVSRGPGNGWSLYATHSFFSRYTLDIGPTAKVIVRWKIDHEDELKAAGVSRVGVRDAEGLSGGAWYEVTPAKK